MRGAADGRRLGDTSGVSSPALGASPTIVIHGHDGRSHMNSGRKILVHPYLVRQMSDFGFRQTLEVRTLGCARRSLSYRSTSDPLVQTKMKMMNNTRDTRFILVRATVVV